MQRAVSLLRAAAAVARAPTPVCGRALRRSLRFLDEFLTELLDLLLLELGDLGLGHFRRLLRLGCFLEGPLDVIKCHGDPLMDLSRLDRQLFGDCEQ